MGPHQQSHPSPTVTHGAAGRPGWPGWAELGPLLSLRQSSEIGIVTILKSPGTGPDRLSVAGVVAVHVEDHAVVLQLRLPEMVEEGLPALDGGDLRGRADRDARVDHTDGLELQDLVFGAVDDG